MYKYAATHTSPPQCPVGDNIRFLKSNPGSEEI